MLGFQTTDPEKTCPPVESWFTTPSNIIVRSAINQQLCNSSIPNYAVLPCSRVHAGMTSCKGRGGMRLYTSCNKWVNIFNLYPVMLEVAKPSAPWPIEVVHAVHILGKPPNSRVEIQFPSITLFPYVPLPCFVGHSSIYIPIKWVWVKIRYPKIMDG